MHDLKPSSVENVFHHRAWKCDDDDVRIESYSEPRKNMRFRINDFGFEIADCEAKTRAELLPLALQNIADVASRAWRRQRTLTMIVQMDMICDNRHGDDKMRSQDLAPLMGEVDNDIWSIQGALAAIARMVDRGEFRDENPPASAHAKLDSEGAQ